MFLGVLFAVGNERRLGALLGYLNIIIKNIVNLVYTPMLLAFVGQADYGDRVENVGVRVTP